MQEGALYVQVKGYKASVAGLLETVNWRRELFL